MRRLVIVLLLIPLVAACGGGGSSKKTTPTPTGASADPGKTALVALIQAARHDDRKALWNVLTTSSQKRLGPYGTFKTQAAPIIEQALRPFESKSLTPFIS